MGDDNEIRQIVRRESEQFLDQARREAHGGGSVYDLEEEFGKTRKNRSVLVWGVTLLTIAALGAAAFVATTMIKRQTEATPVDIQAFQDLNLRDLLDRAKREEADLEQAKVELARIQGEQQSALDAAERDRIASLEAIKARGLRAADEKQKLAAAEAEAAAKKRAVRDRYAQSISAKQADVKVYQEKVDSYDQRLNEQTRKQQELLDNQTRLFDIEKNRLITTYSGQIQDLKDAIKREEAALKRQREELASSLTTRWNPTWEDAKTSSLLKDWKDDPAPRQVPQAALPQGLFSSGSLAKPDAAAADAAIDHLLYLSAQLRAVPYLNSVPPALARVEYEARLGFATWRLALSKAGSAIEDRDRRISDLESRLSAAETSLDHFRWAASQYVLENRDGGYVIDARNTADIVVSLNPAVPVSDGLTGTVVRPGDKAVATLVFFTKDGQARARLLQIQEGERLKSFDPIIVNVSLESPDSGSH